MPTTGTALAELTGRRRPRAWAVETLAALSDVRFALVMQESYGWSLDQLESWMAATSRTLLLGQPS